MVVGHSKDMGTEGTYGYEMRGDMERAATAYIDARSISFLNEVGFKPLKIKEKS